MALDMVVFAVISCYYVPYDPEAERTAETVLKPEKKDNYANDAFEDANLWQATDHWSHSLKAS